jgi:hypothetical protein
MKSSVTQLIRKLALTATLISADKNHFLVTIANLDIDDCKDVAEALDTLAAGFLSPMGEKSFP